MMTKKRPVLYLVTVILLISVVLVIPVAAADPTVLMKEYLNTNLQGSDYATVAAGSKEECATTCVFDAQCKAATWVSAAGQTPSCRLKNAVPPRTPYPAGTTVMHSYIKETNVTITTFATGCPAIPPPDFIADPMEGAAPLTVHFIDNTNSITHVTWDFGDGSTTAGGLHSGFYHTYTGSGTYTLTLTVYDACGQSFSRQKRISVAGQETAGYGNLRADTTPPGAMLYIDGFPAGTTPVGGAVNLTAGVHRIRLVMTGYNDYAEDVTVNPGQEIYLKVALTGSAPGETPPYTPAGSSLKDALKNPTPAQPAAGGPVPGAGTLIVSSNPAGANVYIDGRNEGKTPLTIPGVASGQHTLLLTLQGYTDASRTISVNAAAENQVAVDMTVVKKTPGFAAVAGVLSFALLVVFRRRTG